MPRTLFDDQEPASGAPRREEADAPGAPAPLAERMRPRTLAELIGHEEEVMAEAVRLRKAQGRRTLLFVDEIHRFNRAQQDAFLPYVERGDVVLVGATTENPSFELNAALLSRCRVVVLEALSAGELIELMRRALEDPERGPRRDRGRGGRRDARGPRRARPRRCRARDEARSCTLAGSC